MSEPIKAGDLVQIVRWPCCGAGVGFVFVVHKLTAIGEFDLACSRCNAPHPASKFALSAGSIASRLGAPLPWLKRIDPLPESEREEREEGIPA